MAGVLGYVYVDATSTTRNDEYAKHQNEMKAKTTTTQNRTNKAKQRNPSDARNCVRHQRTFAGSEREREGETRKFISTENLAWCFSAQRIICWHRCMLMFSCPPENTDCMISKENSTSTSHKSISNARTDYVRSSYTQSRQWKSQRSGNEKNAKKRKRTNQKMKD